MSRSKHILFLVFSFIYVHHASAQNKIENALFWEISGNGLDKPSYLFGTYHLLNSDYLEEIPHVKSAFENASSVVVETEIDSSKILQMMSSIIMKDNQLSDLLTPKEYKMVSNEVEQSTEMKMFMLNKFKPSFILMTLTLAYLQKSNGDFFKKYKGQPIDLHFASEGKKNGKNIITLETMQEQMDILFNHDPVDKQAKQLIEFIRSKNKALKTQGMLTQMYLDQDLDGMYSLFKKSKKYEFGDASYMLDDRNIKWMEKLSDLLRPGQFIAVGALHLTGSNSLILLLKQSGYTVKPLKVK